MTVPVTLHDLPRLHQQLQARQMLRRHRHGVAYAAIVLQGSYEEAGDHGRRHLGPGDVALHGAFSAHGNRVGAHDVRLLNLALPSTAETFARAPDPDALARLAERDPQAAASALQSSLQALPATLTDWPDLLARDLALQPDLSLAGWARQHGLAPETLSRGFARVFGLTPRRLRFELRTRQALHALQTGGEALAQVALNAGFADQSHLCHAVVALTGRAPGHWRATSSRHKTSPVRGGTLRG